MPKPKRQAPQVDNFSSETTQPLKTDQFLDERCNRHYRIYIRRVGSRHTRVRPGARVGELSRRWPGQWYCGTRTPCFSKLYEAREIEKRTFTSCNRCPCCAARRYSIPALSREPYSGREPFSGWKRVCMTEQTALIRTNPAIASESKLTDLLRRVK